MMSSDDQFMQATQGVVGLRSYTAHMPQLDAFVSWWNEHTPYGFPGAGLLAQVNIYALFAHDAMWVLARALHNYLKEGQNVTFSPPPVLPPDAGGNMDLAMLNVSRGGPLLLQHMLNLSFTGVTGRIQFSDRGDLVGSQLEVVNIAKGLRVVGYWTDTAGFSTFPCSGDGNSTPTMMISATPAATSKAFPLQSIIWPGGSSIAPRGWVVPENGKPLIIGVPSHGGFREFVSASVMNSMTSYTGFCIDVFLNALAYLPSAVSYTFVSVSNGNGDDLINQVEEKVFPNLSLAETGRLQQIHDLWLAGGVCNPEFDVSSNELGLSTFWGLFLITGSASLLCLILYYMRLMCQYWRVFKSGLIDESHGPSIRRSRDRTSFIRSFMAFIEESEVVDEKQLGTKRKKVKVKRPCLGISSSALRDLGEVEVGGTELRGDEVGSNEREKGHRDF